MTTTLTKVLGTEDTTFKHGGVEHTATIVSVTMAKGEQYERLNIDVHEMLHPSHTIFHDDDADEWRIRGQVFNGTVYQAEGEAVA